ncbi:MAG: RNA polymerase sigma factor [Acidobacteria bacterium]|nr:RNA polymerase sigma factor [Acidobacteriota bacterium]MCW5967266.1 RNA polymerase sigma factor [Blastocatellales bacterium]
MTGEPTRSDEELLRHMLDGDEEAFAALYRRRRTSVYRFALQMCGSDATAEDVTQDVFLALISSAASFDSEKGKLSSFLFGIARNHLLRRVERDRRFTQLDDGDGESESSFLDAGDEFNPLANLARGEIVDSMRRAVLALPPHYREAVVLCDLHDMSYVDAAGVIGCAVGTIRSRLHRARAMLLDKLRTHEGLELPRSVASGAIKGRL